MIAVRELLDVVETREFQHAVRTFQQRPQSQEYRILKSLAHLARGTTKKDERARQRAQTDMASVNAQRQSQQKEQTGHGVSQRIST
jgi:hypothetical protein